MSVYTSVSAEDLAVFLSNYPLGQYRSHKGILGGVTNTNYLVTTTAGRYILTLYETLKAEELPFYLNLTLFLHAKGVACAAPVPAKNQNLSGFLRQKPATLFTYLPGTEISNPNIKQCFNVGAMLAKMHAAAINFDCTMANPRGSKWCRKAIPRLLPKLTGEEQTLLTTAATELNAAMPQSLPAGIIHADLFKDNVLMTADTVAGFIDFYYACNGFFIYDLAIAVNDWARTGDNSIDRDLKAAMLHGYDSVRPLTAAEKKALPAAQRAAALRFWLSRLQDLYFPPPGELILSKNPGEFQQLLSWLQTQI